MFAHVSCRLYMAEIGGSRSIPVVTRFGVEARPWKDSAVGISPLVGLHHVRIPVSDVDRSSDWYSWLFGFEARLLLEEEDRLVGVVVCHPSGLTVGLHRAPDLARTLRGFCPFGVQHRHRRRTHPMVQPPRLLGRQPLHAYRRAPRLVCRSSRSRQHHHRTQHHRQHRPTNRRRGVTPDRYTPRGHLLGQLPGERLPDQSAERTVRVVRGTIIGGLLPFRMGLRASESFGCPDPRLEHCRAEEPRRLR